MSNQNDELPIQCHLPSGKALVLLTDAQRIKDERDRLHDRVHDLLSELSKVIHERYRLRDALSDVLDALGALQKSYELHGYGISEPRASEIVAMAGEKK